MTDYLFADLVAFAKTSTRGRGKCLGFANNDVVAHFGHMGAYPTSATKAANQLAQAGQLFDTPCPSYPHVDFYHFVDLGVDLGHVDWHFPQHGVHIADSSRTTVKLNPAGTVGEYANWGTRRGWAKVPALNAQISFVNDPTPPPPPAPSVDLDTIARQVIAGKWGNGSARVAALSAAGYDAHAVQARVNAILAGGVTAHPTYTVMHGDNLSGIAAKLHITGGWPALYSNNKAVIGPNPNRILPGMVLVLP